MKKLLFFLLLFSSFSSRAQISYHHYFDSTYETRFYMEAYFMYSTHSYITSYFDGDTLINNNWYYKVYSLRLDSAFTTIPSVTTTLNGPGFRREDIYSNIIGLNPNTGIEDTIWNWNQVNAMTYGDHFDPYPTCPIYLVDSIYLGNIPLRRVRSQDSVYSVGGGQKGVVEGLGYTGVFCGTGYESDGWIACYTSHGVSIEFSSISCLSFPEPIRTGYYTANLSLGASSLQAKQKVVVYPTYSTGKVNISLPQQNHEWVISVRDIQGRLVKHTTLVNAGSLEINAPNGLYFVSLFNTSTKFRQVEKIVIQN